MDEIAFRYVAEQNPHGGYLPGVPLRDLTVADVAAAPVWLRSEHRGAAVLCRPSNRPNPSARRRRRRAKMAEIPFEYMLFGLESARGTKLDPPTHYLNMAGTVTPQTSVYRPDESTGTLAEYHRSAIVRKWSEWEGEGGADVYSIVPLLEMLVKGAGHDCNAGRRHEQPHAYLCADDDGG